MEHETNKVAARAFAAAFGNAISESIRQASGSAWPLDVMDAPEPPSRRAQTVQFSLKIDGGLRGECFAEFYEPQVSELAAKLAGGKGEASEGEPVKSLETVVSSAAGAAGASLASRYGEFSIHVEAVSGLAFGGMLVVPLASPDNPAQANVLLYFNGELLDALSSTAAGGREVDTAGRSVHAGNLKLVMDVELNVSLRFGQRQLPLREVLELGSGSVVELDRMVDEPVELLLDGKLIARGEAVIVDGNYGLRVTEIPQAMETHLLG
ncbi:MAG TPA: flagellar motor switch protein FliN [Terracidiphilus sp.]|nr:flagellar motor switch protein FliN [Terracidiphilus sp.]